MRLVPSRGWSQRKRYDHAKPGTHRAKGKSRLRTEKGLRGLQVDSREPLGKAIVNRRQQFARFSRASLSIPKPSKADGGPQLPGNSALPARHIQGSEVMLLRPHYRIGQALPFHQGALDAQQLGHDPVFVVTLAMFERLSDRGQSLGNLARLC